MREAFAVCAVVGLLVALAIWRTQDDEDGEQQ